MPASTVAANAAIASECFAYGPIKLCVDIRLDEVCVDLTLLGVQVSRHCAEWSVEGSKLSVRIQSSTRNTGIWKLEHPTIDVEQDTETNDGQVRLTARLYKLRVLPPGYKKVKEWNGDAVAEW